MDSLDGYVADDELAIEPLARRGWAVETLSWRQSFVDWDYFDAVVIRTTWDYQSDPMLFLNVLRQIEASDARLENPLEIVRWNLDKSYLRSLETDGVAIVPTLWDRKYDHANFREWQNELRTDDLIIKPNVSATAEFAFRLSEFDASVEEIFAERPFLVQPFMESIVNEGEYSLFYFSGEFSHAIVKTPKAGDFRVQEEHGGEPVPFVPDRDMLDTGRFVFDMISPTPLYARVDLVRSAGGQLLLMELELVEPALYLRMDAGAPERFAAAFDRMMSHSA
jgi:glutathione synthase/RimK-type ligase-like ATP-grasp enzyme